MSPPCCRGGRRPLCLHIKFPGPFQLVRPSCWRRPPESVRSPHPPRRPLSSTRVRRCLRTEAGLGLGRCRRICSPSLPEKLPVTCECDKSGQYCAGFVDGETRRDNGSRFLTLGDVPAGHTRQIFLGLPCGGGDGHRGAGVSSAGGGAGGRWRWGRRRVGATGVWFCVFVCFASPLFD